MIVSCILIYQTHRLREKRLPLKMLTCHCFENLCKYPAARGAYLNPLDLHVRPSVYVPVGLFVYNCFLTTLIYLL